MEPMLCSNEKCRWSTEKRGGKFRYRGGKPYCEECVPTDHYAGEPGKNLWEFETMNISSKANEGPIRVQSLRHLRQLERQHGVVSVAANFDSSRWNDAPRGR